MEIEVWNPITEYNGDYEVSNLGNVRSLKNYGGLKRLTKLSTYGGRYLRVSLSKNNKRRLHSVARLVAKAFVLNPECKPQVNHISGDKLDNRVENLEWVTASENILHAFKLGIRNNRSNGGPAAKLTEGSVKRMRLMHEVNPSLTHQKIADMFGVERTNAGLILRRKTWSHVI